MAHTFLKHWFTPFPLVGGSALLATEFVCLHSGLLLAFIFCSIFSFFAEVLLEYVLNIDGINQVYLTSDIPLLFNLFRKTYESLY